MINDLHDYEKPYPILMAEAQAEFDEWIQEQRKSRKATKEKFAAVHQELKAARKRGEI